MSHYPIDKGIHKKAKLLGVQVFSSDNPKKKLDIYDNEGTYWGNIGAAGMMDYWLYKKEFGLKLAKERREMYTARHAKNIAKVGSKGWYAYQLLWDGDLE